MTIEALNRHQIAKAGETLGRQLDFYTVRTLVDISAGAADAVSQKRLNHLIQLISLRGQPVILNAAKVSVETDPADLAGATAGAEVDVFTLKFAIEHEGAWENATPTLAQTIIAEVQEDGVAVFSEDNLAVQYHVSL